MDISVLRTELENASDRGKSLVEALDELVRLIEDYEEQQYIKDEQEGKREDNLVLKGDEVCKICAYSASGEICSNTHCRECQIYYGECYCVSIPNGAPCKHFRLEEGE
jgi:hypothetical protein